MDKIKAKVDGLLHKDHSDTSTTGTTTHNTHNTTASAGGLTGNSGTHSGVHGDERHGNPSHIGSTGHTGGLDGSTARTGGAGLTGSTHNTSGHANTHSDPSGPHKTHLANQLDPRVDSTTAGGYGNTTGAGGYGSTTGTGNNLPLSGNNTHSSHAGTHSGGGLASGNTYGSDPTGPHDSRIGNKADPRVDSDRVGGYGNTTQTEGFGNQHGGGLSGTTAHTSHNQHGLTGQGSHLPGNATSGGLGGVNHQGQHGGLSSGNTYSSDPTGPHDSRLGNKADPRVDSDRVGGYGNTTQTEGFGNQHSSGGLSGTTAHTSHNQHGSHLPGPAQNTAGPHKSDLLNKADPRVDADLDGSKTYGGDKTYGN